MEVYPLSPKNILNSIAKMYSKISLALALVCLSRAVSTFAADMPVPPSLGGEGIQSALDALPAGGEVLLGAGSYLIHQPVILRNDHLTLRGGGASTVLYLADNANCPVVVLGSPSDEAKSTKDVRLADLFIDGNRRNQQKEVWRLLSDGAGVYNNGVDVWNVDGASVEQVVCCRCRSGGMVTSARTRRLTVRDYTAFDNQFDGLACYLTEDSDFSRLNLHDNLSAGISLDLSFNHNVIHDSVLTGNDLGIFMRQSRDNVFQGLTIQKSRHHGVFMAQSFVETALGLKPSPGSECAGNTFDNLLVAHCGGKGFLVNDATCTNNVICGGQFEDDAQGGLAQAVPNLVTMRVLAGSSEPTHLEAALPVVHQLLDHVAAGQTTPKVL
jgi:hypothetical protein